MNRQVKTRKSRSIVLLASIALFSCTALAKYSGGTGEPSDPYQIANVADLMTLASDANDYNTCFIMTADIDLDPNLPGRMIFATAVIACDINNTNGFFDGNSFAGVFDGAGHKILNLRIDTNGIKNDYLGLFGDINGGEIKNLGMENVRIAGGNESESIGGLSGINYYATINNCYTTSSIAGGSSIGGLAGRSDYSDINNCFSISTVNGGGSTGGLAGWNRIGSINNCFSTSTVSGSTYIGGLVGYNDRGEISNSFTTSTVTGGVQSHYLGGLTGCNNGGAIRHCSSTGIVAHNYSDYIGGLAGYNGGSISECNSTARITGTNNTNFIGGLAGYNTDTIRNSYSTGNVSGGMGLQKVGGLAGYNGGSINNCYSTGTVKGVSYVGGLIGYNTGTCVSSFWDVNTSGKGGSAGGMGKTTVQMKTLLTFTSAGWDFVGETVNGPNDIWAICEGVSYPKLVWEFIAGDSNNDKYVDFADFAPLGNKWLQADSDLYCRGADFTGDGLVDIEDLDIFLDNWLQ